MISSVATEVRERGSAGAIEATAVADTATLCHDMRTCVNQLVGFAELMIECSPEEADATLRLKAVLESANAVLPAITDVRHSTGATAAGLEEVSKRLLGQCGIICDRVEAVEELKDLLDQGDVTKLRNASRTLFALAGTLLPEPPEAPCIVPVVAAKSNGASAPAVDSTPPPVRAGPHRAAILIVDDNADNRELLARLLEREDCRICLAENGRRALEMLTSEPFDLVLLDLIMPEVDGLTVLSHIKSDAQLRDTPVIMISGVDEINSVVRCIEIGAEDYLQKPFNRVLLRARVNVLLERKHLRDEERKRGIELESALKELEHEKQHVENLLLNILPRRVAEELEAHGTVEPMYYNDITVAFTDFVGFTRSTESLPAEELVQFLHRYFSAFDEIMDRYRLEKLKTIGDSYMFAAGIPEYTTSHPVDAVLAALEMVEVVKRNAALEHSPKWEVRVGIHSGPAIAGVVGKNKFAFDLWGDTINMGSRMESNSRPNCINVSRITYARVKDFFACEHRGLVTIRDGWDVDMYFINGVVPNLLGGSGGERPAGFRRRYEKYFQSPLKAFPEFLLEPDPPCR